MYHRVLPVDSPARRAEQPGMYVFPETFDLHLTEIKRYFELVDLADWLRRSRRGESLPRLACAITFDDGWRDNHDYALPLLVKHGAPATVFLVSEYVGTAYRFWPNRLMNLLRTAFDHPEAVTFPNPLGTIVEPVLADARSRGELRAEDADLAVQRAKAFDEGTIRGLIDATAVVNDQPSGARDILDREEIGRMAATGLVRFGSHTATHFRLAGEIAPADLEREIVEPRRTLQALTGQDIDLFCYPNGDTSATAVDCVRRHFLGAVTTRAGWVAGNPDLHLLPRIGVHDDATRTREGFLATLSGWI
jgi:peptidoglycan/xylan/chitin deacetylase (PgdA/CDA1 family)